MSKEKEPKLNNQYEKRNSLLARFITREEPDREYMPELETQWAHMDPVGKIKFVLGAIVGAILFFGALYLVYILLSTMVG